MLTRSLIRLVPGGIRERRRVGETQRRTEADSVSQVPAQNRADDGAIVNDFALRSLISSSSRRLARPKSETAECPVVVETKSSALLTRLMVLITAIAASASGTS
jgi:hypothetical protein